jgi:circadian clock protein KaiC
MLARLIDFMKVRQMTALFTSLTTDEDHPEGTDVGISSFMDAWLVLRNIERNGERTRALSVLKSRGMAHSNQVREFVLTSHGLKLLDVVRDQGRVLVGSDRAAHVGEGSVAARRMGRRALRR